MENNKLKVKDLVNIGIFSALYMVISMIVMIPVGIAPILWLIWPGIAGLFGGAFFTLLMTKVPKQGAALILAIITGLLYFATGECTWVIIVTLPEFWAKLQERYWVTNHSKALPWLADLPPLVLLVLPCLCGYFKMPT